MTTKKAVIFQRNSAQENANFVLFVGPEAEAEIYRAALEASSVAANGDDTAFATLGVDVQLVSLTDPILAGTSVFATSGLFTPPPEVP